MYYDLWTLNCEQKSLFENLMLNDISFSLDTKNFYKSNSAMGNAININGKFYRDGKWILINPDGNFTNTICIYKNGQILCKDSYDIGTGPFNLNTKLINLSEIYKKIYEENNVKIITKN